MTQTSRMRLKITRLIWRHIHEKSSWCRIVDVASLPVLEVGAVRYKPMVKPESV